MAILGTTRLTIANGSAAVKRLDNGRFRLEFLADTKNPNTDWYKEKIDGILPTLTAKQEDFFGAGIDESWVAIPASVYDNMRCVESEYAYISSIGEKRVSLAYETLTAAWVQEKDDTIDYEANGLRRVSRVSVSLPETAYASVVGSTSIDSDGTTVWLANRQINRTDSKWTLNEVWIEAGLLSKGFSTASDGIIDHSYTWLKTVGSTPDIPNPVISSQKIGDYQGLQTITVGYKGLPASGSFSYQTTVPFTIPGVITSSQESLGAGVENIIVENTPPVPTVADATVVVTYSKVSSVDTTGIWQPVEWSAATISGVGFGLRPISSTNTMQNHIRIGSGRSITDPPSGTIACCMGTNVYGGTTATIKLTGPTFDPAGTSIILSISNDPTFLDENGDQYYKKTVVTAAIPARP